MDNDITERTISVADQPIRLLEYGSGTTTVLLLHGGTPGRTPYLGSADLWNPLAFAIDNNLRVIAPDLPGTGGTTAQSVEDLTVAGRAQFIAAIADNLGLGELHLVSHAEADLTALLVARESAVHVKSVTLISPVGAIPTGDRSQDLTLLHPPRPLWSMRSQRWALERLSRNIEHVTDEMLATMVTHSDDVPHASIGTLLRETGVVADLQTDRTASTDALYGYARDVGFEAPITLVCGANDPLVEIDRAAVLMEILSTTRAPLDLQIIGDCGHFPFREHPQKVAKIISNKAVLPLSKGGHLQG